MLQKFSSSSGRLFLTPLSLSSVPKNGSNFLLDCTNLQNSRLQQYHSDKDKYLTPYVHNILQKVKSDIKKGKNQIRIKEMKNKTLSKQQFNQFIQTKLQYFQKVNSRPLQNAQKQIRLLSEKLKKQPGKIR